MLVIRRIHVKYRLQADLSEEETIRRVHDMHARYCPVYRTLQESIEMTTEVEVVSG